VTALIGWLYRSALKRGARGQHWAWYIVALGAWVLRRDRDHRGSALLRVPIKPGDRIEVSMRELSADER
jgi:hypothetical protein